VLRQRALLRAAVFGRAFASHVPRDLLRSVAVKLRLLNALREPDVGLPLTMPQLDALSLPVVVSRYVGQMCLAAAWHGRHEVASTGYSAVCSTLPCNELACSSARSLHAVLSVQQRCRHA